MTPQRIFDITVAYLLAQGGPSLAFTLDKSAPACSPLPTCAYRGVEGRRCAVGLWIGDKHYVPDMEKRTTIDSLIASHGPSLPPYVIQNRGLLSRLQQVHDGSLIVTRKSESDDWNLPAFRAQMRDVAHEFNLDPGVLEIAE